MPSATPRQGTWLVRLDLKPQIEGTLHWVPVEAGGALFHWPNATVELVCVAIHYRLKVSAANNGRRLA